MIETYLTGFLVIYFGILSMAGLAVFARYGLRTLLQFLFLFYVMPNPVHYLFMLFAFNLPVTITFTITVVQLIAFATCYTLDYFRAKHGHNLIFIPVD